MSKGLTISFFGSSLVSAYWNGAATYYRGIIKALADRGHLVTFYEPDAFDRQQNRDMADPDWANVVVYSAEGTHDVLRCLEAARGSDIVVKASGVGVFDELLEDELTKLKSPQTTVVFWDVDAPATLERVRSDLNDPFRGLIPKYDLVLTYGGGPPVIDAYRELGARECVPIYNAVDPQTHQPAAPEQMFRSRLAFLGNRLPDREARVQEFLVSPARHMRNDNFVLGGSGWHDNFDCPDNVRRIGHVYTHQHNAFNCTPMAVLNISRDSMARFGYSPATRVFEAAGAGACMISDSWKGIEEFLEPESEILLAESGDAVVEQLNRLTPDRSRRIGKAARQRVLRDHTYAHRAAQVEDVFSTPPA